MMLPHRTPMGLSGCLMEVWWRFKAACKRFGAVFMVSNETIFSEIIPVCFNAPFARRLRFIRGVASWFAIMLMGILCGGARGIALDSVVGADSSRPNIVVLVADDWSWPHASRLGDPVVKTPNFDRVANEGVLLANAFVSTPSCTPSRLSILTGQHHWRLKEGDSLGGSLREEFPVYSELLQQQGYRIGRFGKGVWPSKHAFRGRDSFGKRYRSFGEFLQERANDQPFCFWYGGKEPHRPYEKNIGVKNGIDVSQIQVPACLPDHETVRGDLADYLWQVQCFDQAVGNVLKQLEQIDELENTLIVVTSDNGMPFPRCKATLYDLGTRVPLAIRWGNRIKRPVVVEDFVSLCDLAPTFLEVAGVAVPRVMTGRSLLPLLEAGFSGVVDSARTFALSGNEKHVYRYPSRSIRTKDFLYIRNWNSADWPSGNIAERNPTYDFAVQPWPTEAGSFSFNIDPSPTKQFLRQNRHDPAVDRLAMLAFHRPGDEELFDLSRDSDQINNVANTAEYAKVRLRLRRQLDAELIRTDDPRSRIPGYRNQSIVGWPVRISETLQQEQPVKTRRAIELMTQQLKKLTQVLPAESLAAVQDVPIWISGKYNGFRPKAEYHPNVQWLRKAGRRPELVECVELTNTEIFERECKRMPMLMLHELAHAYHHQVLTVEQPDILAAYKQARASGSYEAVQRGNGKIERAYGMTNHNEYFAETSEAFFGVNDFFPFNRDELRRHDPRMHELLKRLWNVEDPVQHGADPANPSPALGHQKNGDDAKAYRVSPPPARLKLDPFYSKYTDASGYPVVASESVNDYALKEAAYLVDMMLKQRPDVRQAMIDSGSRMIVMGHDEFTTDIPEYSHLKPKDFWDARARGLGGSREEPVCSCAEENVLAFRGDPYSSENILIHEFAHNIHLRGLVNLDPTFDDRLRKVYQQAMERGLWKGKYASTNHAEYFAEGVQSWFNNNRQPDHDHNHVDTRRELREYDPGLAAICKEVFGTTDLVYTKPQTRLHGHLSGYDPDKSPEFQWPAHLKEQKRKIIEDVKRQGDDRERVYKN